MKELAFSCQLKVMSIESHVNCQLKVMSIESYVN